MAADYEGSFQIDCQFDRLSLTSEGSSKLSADAESSKYDDEFTRKWGFRLKELYKLGLKFYRDKEGKALNLSYQDKLTLLALAKQSSSGKYDPSNCPPVGVLDVIGRDRRQAWQALGNMTQEDTMANFIDSLDNKCSSFRPFIEAHKADIENRKKRKLEEEKLKQMEEERLRLETALRERTEEERLKQEHQKSQIQEALNQQTYAQFKAYTEQQYPGDPVKQGELLIQLQEQHYQQYIQQIIKIVKQDQANDDETLTNGAVYQGDSPESEDEEGPSTPPNLLANLLKGSCKLDSVECCQDPICTQGHVGGWQRQPPNPSLQLPASWPIKPDNSLPKAHINFFGGSHIITEASMWTRKDGKEFKEAIRKEGGDSIIRVGHGETVTVRVPTNDEGTCLFWEFATDYYDIGFGVYFEWTKSPTNQVSVHVSESEDEDDYLNDDEDDDDDDLEGYSRGDVERGAKVNDVNRVPISIIIPICKRKCQDEVYAGSHAYPGQGVYLLKFDNSYSVLRISHSSFHY